MSLARLRTALFALFLAPTALAQITEFCAGDGTGTVCPCSNHSEIGADVGCLNSLGLGGKLRALGVPSLSDDGDGSASLLLNGTQMTNSFYAYFQGTASTSAHFGDGLRCVGGTVIRLHWPPRLNVGGASHFPDDSFTDPPISQKGLVSTPGTRYYQCFYRDAVAFCTPWTFTTTNAVEVVWGS